MTINFLKEKISQPTTAFNNKTTTGIVFLDPKIDDYEMLMAGVKPGLEVFLLDENFDGIGQITQVLKGHCGLSSLHIVAHGEEGKLWLGNGLVNSNTLDQQRDNLQFWAAAFAPDADILIYGCKVAAGKIGRQFVQLLSQITGADVAASNNLTGSAALGGDWELEVKIGNVEAPIAFGQETIKTYDAVFPNSGNGYDYIVGTDGDDYLVGDTGDTLIGGAGNDTLVGHNLNANARIYGGTGDDTYIVDSTTSLAFYPLFDESGLDTVISSASNYSLGQGLDNLILTGNAISGLGNGLSNVMTGNNLDNSLWGFEGNDTLSGGDGNDVLYAGGRDTGRQIIEYTPFDGDNYLDGGNGNDSLYGGWGSDTLIGGAGNDYLSGYLGNDSLFGGAGDDYLRGGFDYDTGDDNDYLDGGDGNDTLIGDYGNDTLYGGYGSDNLFGGNGDDYLDGGGTSFYDTSNDSLSGGNGNDYLLGGLGADTLNGDDGEDYLNGYDGNDILNGGAGNDSLIGGAGNDSLIGGTGDDTYYVDSTGDVITENINEGTDTVFSSINYTLGANLENLTLLDDARVGYGNDLNNILNGNDTRNYLDGGAGNDTINGAGGNDIIVGKAGNDSLLGGEGNDYLMGYQDNDFLSGGNGNDTLEAYGASINEVDILSGGFGADIFRLGVDPSNVLIFYRGNGNSYAVITDFSRSDGDKIDILGTSSSFSNYNFTQSGNDTQISYQNDLIAVVQNTVASSFIQSDFI